MKKLVVLLSVTVVLAMAACGDEEQSGPATTVPTVPTATVQSTPVSPPATATVQPTPPSSPTPPTSAGAPIPSPTARPTVTQTPIPAAIANPTVTPPPPPPPTATPTVVPVTTVAPTATPVVEDVGTPVALFLEITSPDDESVLTSDSVEVTGRTVPDAVVSVNGEPVEVDADGGFTVTVTLGAGPNFIEVVTSDFSGGQIEEIRSVIYQAQ